MSGDNPLHPRRRNSNYLLSGLAYCAHCGSPLSGLSARQRSGEYYERYICSRRKRNHDCDAEGIPRIFLDELIIEHVIEHVLDPANLADCQVWIHSSADERQAELNRKRDELKSRLAAVRRRITNIVDVMADARTSRSLIEKLLDLEAEEAGLLSDLAALDRQALPEPDELTESQLTAQAERLAADLRSSDIETVRRTLRGIVSKVIIEREGEAVRLSLEYFFPLAPPAPPGADAPIIQVPLGAPAHRHIFTHELTALITRKAKTPG